MHKNKIKNIHSVSLMRGNMAFYKQQPLTFNGYENFQMLTFNKQNTLLLKIPYFLL